MATLGRRPGQSIPLQASLHSSLSGATVPVPSQVGGQAGPLRLGDVVMLYVQDKASYVFSEISRYRVFKPNICLCSQPLFAPLICRFHGESMGL